MIERMAELHMSEAEVANDFAAVLEKVVRQGVDVVVEHTGSRSRCCARHFRPAAKSQKCWR